MSPLKRKKLDKIRIELDKLDNSLIKIIRKRTNLVKKVLALKDKKNQIVDKKRIETILKNINYPLAMPSANMSSGVSPVSAFDVYEEFKKKVQLIIDGGQSKIGIESTVVDLTEKPKILRPGIINTSDIEKILKLKIKKKVNTSKIKSPGMMKKHYSPGIPVLINQKKYDGNRAFIYLGNKYKNRK